MRLLSQMHSSFRDVSGSLSVRSSSSFYLLAPPVPPALPLFLSLSLSLFFFRFPLVFCRTPSLSILHDTHKHHAHSRSRPPPPRLSPLSTTSLSLSLSPTSCSFFSTHPSPPLVFFSPHHYNGAALFGPGHKQPRIGTTPWCRLAVILYNTCNGCCDGSPGHPLRERDILYEGETIARTRRSTTGFK